jgi:hypothetical protein
MPKSPQLPSANPTAAERADLVKLLTADGWQSFTIVGVTAWRHPTAGIVPTLWAALLKFGRQHNASVDIIVNDNNGKMAYSVGLMLSDVGEVEMVNHFADDDNTNAIDAAEQYAKRLAGWFGVPWGHVD